jgi:hypothetical protein
VFDGLAKAGLDFGSGRFFAQAGFFAGMVRI